MRSFVLVAALLVAGCGGTTPPQPGPDMAQAGGDMTLLPFGAPCMMGSDCASNVCFVGGNRSFCSLHCTAATQAMDCPVPPTSGVCNMQGYCKP